MAIAQGSFGAQIHWAFTDRTQGQSAAPYDSLNLAEHVGDDPLDVRANRMKVAALIGAHVDDVVSMDAVHGNAVAIVTSTSTSPVAQVDAMVTSTPQRALLVVGADCSPVVLGDSEAGVIGVAHSGWRGIVSDVSAEVVAAMCSLGATPEGIHAVVGPSVCGQCYQVDQDRFDAAVAVAPESGVMHPDGTLGLDIRLGVLAQLRACGVHVSTWGGCTFEDARLFSYRRDSLTGRQGAMIVIGAGA